MMGVDVDVCRWLTASRVEGSAAEADGGAARRAETRERARERTSADGARCQQEGFDVEAAIANHRPQLSSVH